MSVENVFKTLLTNSVKLGREKQQSSVISFFKGLSYVLFVEYTVCYHAQFLCFRRAANNQKCSLGKVITWRN